MTRDVRTFALLAFPRRLSSGHSGAEIRDPVHHSVSDFSRRSAVVGSQTEQMPAKTGKGMTREHFATPSLKTCVSGLNIANRAGNPTLRSETRSGAFLDPLSVKYSCGPLPGKRISYHAAYVYMRFARDTENSKAFG